MTRTLLSLPRAWVLSMVGDHNHLLDWVLLFSPLKNDSYEEFKWLALTQLVRSQTRVGILTSVLLRASFAITLLLWTSLCILSCRSSTANLVSSCTRKAWLLPQHLLDSPGNWISLPDYWTAGCLIGHMALAAPVDLCWEGALNSIPTAVPALAPPP